MSFEDAVKALKAGKKISRAEWCEGGSWMYLYIYRFPNDIHNFQPVVVFHSDKLEQPGWLPAQTDFFAEDWMVLT